MFQGIDPKMMKQAMKKMGMQQEDIEATEVIIKTTDKEILIRNPHVAKVKMMGQESFQITGDVEEREQQSFTEDDVKTVAAQASVSEKEAREALEKNNGDLAAAILALKEK
ncbi:MAG: nascent polypeptide-associated complex protein [Nanoarchaeota archaeon]